MIAAVTANRRIDTRFLRLLRDDRSGMAIVEFALALPFFVGFTMGGVELTNYTTTKMRMSQIALQVADNASRIGTGNVMAAKQISEAQVNDILTGAGLQADALDLYGRGRVIVYSLEPMANPNPTNLFRIRWKRCRGAKTTYPGNYTQGQTNIPGFLYTPPVGLPQTITAPVGGAVMVVQLSYTYRPLITQAFVLKSEITEFGAMTVRDPRDMAGPTGGVGLYNTENVTISSC